MPSGPCQRFLQKRNETFPSAAQGVPCVASAKQQNLLDSLFPTLGAPSLSSRMIVFKLPSPHFYPDLSCPCLPCYLEQYASCLSYFLSAVWFSCPSPRDIAMSQ
eukprot:1159113-Pelagomonas_calceolata.AAC.14